MAYHQQIKTNDVIPDIMKELQDIVQRFQSEMATLNARQIRVLAQISNTFEQQQRNREVDGQSDL